MSEYNRQTQTKSVTTNKPKIIITSFVFLCVAIAVLNIGINIPVFSEIFSPTTATMEFSYITEVKTKINTDKSNKYLLIQVTPNPQFDKFNSLYFELYNLTLDEKVVDYSIINKADLSVSWALIPFKINDPVYDLELRIYCSTDNPEDIKYSNSFVKDEITYYFIYTYENIIKI